ncbi:GNAT family N-acetyltransferase [Streptomyces sp. ISL-86]|uniref:GNAT family N-acetyltransferase n=1 Tax=Streptomyces sp. ISL-86 TaxID=2819187 RepID=UPI001BE6C086|nr:GNAT family N-acetyltransferase [Streptomyces sp. ISL-86]MBT2456155.1 GNAT family N-acetyltransferase [Streptomyces sp. ISL-86]
MEPITLTTDRLVLTPFTPADIDAVHAACQDPAIQRWLPLPSPYRREEAESFILHIAPAGWREDTEYTFAVRLAADGALAGAVSARIRGQGTYEIGYWGAKEFRGRGLITEAVGAVARWAFDELGCARMEWRAEVGNTASRTVAEKAGFRLEGVQRAGLDHNGTRRDCWLASLLPADLGLPSSLPYLPAVSSRV